jgi:hypothetical protein
MVGMNTHTSQATQTAQVAPPARTSHRLTVAAGWALVAIAVLHTVVFAGNPYWAGWIGGSLRTGAADAGSVATFWALPGSFVPTALLLGLLTVRLGRRGERAPAYVGWVLLAWALGCIYLVGVSGFILVLVPATLILVGAGLARRDRSPSAR